MTSNIHLNQSASASHPPNPNTGQLHPQSSHVQSISHQPSPAIIASASHTITHPLPRRFIGAIPESAANSPEAQEKHERLRAVRTAAVKRISGVHDASRKGTKALGDKRRSMQRSIRIRRTGNSGEVLEHEIPIDVGSSDDEEQTRGWFGKKGKQRRKDVWVGESFDIGREFKSAPTSVIPDNIPLREAVSEVNPTAGPSNVITPHPPIRPGSSSRQTTQETFVTARTHTSGRSIAESETSMNRLESIDDTHTLRPARSIASVPTAHRDSHASSTEPLVANAPSMSPTISTKSRGKLRSLYPDLSSSKSTPNLRNRLKSAIRRPSGADQSFSEVGRDTTVRGKSKTVQFPVELEHHIEETAKPTPGNKAPADPGDVLSREGEDAAGTSAGAAEEAMGEEEEEEDPIMPGEVIMRGMSNVGSRANSRSDAC